MVLRASFKTTLLQTQSTSHEAEYKTSGIAWHQVARFHLFAFLQEPLAHPWAKECIQDVQEKIKRDFLIVVFCGTKDHSLCFSL